MGSTVPRHRLLRISQKDNILKLSLNKKNCRCRFGIEQNNAKIIAMGKNIYIVKLKNGVCFIHQLKDVSKHTKMYSNGFDLNKITCML